MSNKKTTRTVFCIGGPKDGRIIDVFDNRTVLTLALIDFDRQMRIQPFPPSLDAGKTGIDYVDYEIDRYRESDKTIEIALPSGSNIKGHVLEYLLGQYVQAAEKRRNTARR
jgi:hypothetical protein